jgi:hypothetical protein
MAGSQTSSSDRPFPAGRHQPRARKAPRRAASPCRDVACSARASAAGPLCRSVAHPARLPSATAALRCARSLRRVRGVLSGVNIRRAPGGGPQPAMRATTSVPGSPTVRSCTRLANLDPPTARPTRPARSSWSRTVRHTRNSSRGTSTAAGSSTISTPSAWRETAWRRKCESTITNGSYKRGWEPVARVEPSPSGSACTLGARTIASGPSADTRNSCRTPGSHRRAKRPFSLLRESRCLLQRLRLPPKGRCRRAYAPLRSGPGRRRPHGHRPQHPELQTLLPSGGWQRRFSSVRST